MKKIVCVPKDDGMALTVTFKEDSENIITDKKLYDAILNIVYKYCLNATIGVDDNLVRSFYLTSTNMKLIELARREIEKL